jgi:DNA-binding Xre family transcriptional regulator
MGIVSLQIAQAARRVGIQNPFALSKATGIGYAICYRMWKNGQSRIDLKTLARLCDALNCQPGDLFGYESQKKKSRSPRNTTSSKK